MSVFAREHYCRAHALSPGFPLRPASRPVLRGTSRRDSLKLARVVPSPAEEVLASVFAANTTAELTQHARLRRDSLKLARCVSPAEEVLASVFAANTTAELTQHARLRRDSLKLARFAHSALTSCSPLLRNILVLAHQRLPEARISAP